MKKSVFFLNKRKTIFKVLLLVLFSIGFVSIGYTQEKSKKELRKELKEQEKIEKQKLVEDLVNGKTFVFQPNTALPTGARTITIPSNNYSVTFKPDLIDCDLPYFGRATAPMAYGSSDGGIKFNEKPEEYSIKNKNKKFDIEVEVKDKEDNYMLYLSVRSEGYATLRIISNLRTPISFNGEIRPLKTEE